ncbi:golgin subfamily A member 6-like protein 25 [Macrobrachium rosenbergii]|uniref:golgin subfamily A member 6-like protein 25 n=1 Tax=Macrobrachium rosenbergii TaxID=79674 RepID=UPI0034D3EF0E
MTDVGWHLTDDGWPTGVPVGRLIGVMVSVGLYAYKKWIRHQKQKQRRQGQAVAETRPEQLSEERNPLEDTGLEQLFREKDLITHEAEEMKKIRNEAEAEIQKRNNVIKELANKLEIALNDGEKTKTLLAEANRRDKALGEYFKALEAELLVKHGQTEDLLKQQENWKREKLDLEHQIQKLEHKTEVQGKKTANFLAEAHKREQVLGDYIRILEADVILKHHQIESLSNEQQNWKREKQELENQIEVALHHGQEMKNWCERQKTRADEMELYLTLREYETKVRHSLAVEVKKRDEKIEEMANELEVALHHGKEMEKLVEKEKAKANEMDRHLTNLRENEKKLRDRFAVEVKNRDEKTQEMAGQLVSALHHGKKMENYLKILKARADETDRCLTSLRQYKAKITDRFAVEVKKRDEKIEEMANKLEDALHHGQKMENLLKIEKAKAHEKGRYLTSLREYKTTKFRSKP